MPTLILVRHGETTWNLRNYYQGQSETNLSELGIVQMQIVARLLDSKSFHTVYSSPLERARHSAEIIVGNSNMPLSIDKNLMEMDLGCWVGQDYRVSEVENWFENAPHGGETGSVFLSRLSTFVSYSMPSILQGSCSLIVGHGLVIQGLLSILLGRSINYWRDQPIENGAITELSYVEDIWRLNCFNDTAHLSD